MLVRSNRRVALITGAESASQLSYSPGVENFPGFPEPTRGLDILDKMEEQAIKSKAEVIHEDVKAIILDKKPFVIHYGFDKLNPKVLKARSIILCMGAKARTLDVPGADECWSVSSSSCALCDSHMVQNQPTMVVGGGDTAMEEALYLTRYTDVVYLVHRRDEFRASGVMQDKLAKSGVRTVLESEVEEIVGGPHMTSVVVKNVRTGSRQEIHVHSLFYGIGHIPATDMVKDKLETHNGGFLKLKEGSQMTSLQGVFAAGDIADFTSRQAVCAAGQGAAAAIEACRWLERVYGE
eukprot:gnl/Chilomastix_caulleri/811.p1 GENE.gnl/Chilomastix_caulleri/811~~gnl/Chilomastix_caulleri/811.p1  ORF type:complete len:294 (+),score=97.69 gnl/Chilomastix_caulleri/811:155-1036(+)